MRPKGLGLPGLTRRGVLRRAFPAGTGLLAQEAHFLGMGPGFPGRLPERKDALRDLAAFFPQAGVDVANDHGPSMAQHPPGRCRPVDFPWRWVDFYCK